MPRRLRLLAMTEEGICESESWMFESLERRAAERAERIAAGRRKRLADEELRAKLKAELEAGGVAQWRPAGAARLENKLACTNL